MILLAALSPELNVETGIQMESTEGYHSVMSKCSLLYNNLGYTIASQRRFEPGSLVWRASFLPITPSGPATLNFELNTILKKKQFEKVLSIIYFPLDYGLFSEALDRETSRYR